MMELHPDDIVIRDSDDKYDSAVWVNGKWYTGLDRRETLDMIARTRMERAMNGTVQGVR